MENPPNPTLYVQNLNEKIKKEELKKSLYHVFSQFGGILEINCKKSLALRGQAWIIFEDLAPATKALREMQSFNFYGKPMKLAYAKVKSDIVAKKDGSFVPRPKRGADGKGPKQPAPAKKAKAAVQAVQMDEDEDGETSSAAAPAPKKAAAPSVEEAPPNFILFVENLPEQCSEMMLSMLFQQYNGFKEARLVPSKPGIAFVEFGDQFQAATAKESLQDFKITPTNLMKISFARQ